VPPERLKDSRAKRDEILRYLRFEPTSIWFLKKGRRVKRLDEFIDDRPAKGSYVAHEYSVRSGALSQFPAEVARRAILMWSREGDLMFDPFGARAARALMANLLKRHVIAYDISQAFYDWVMERLKRGVPNPEYTFQFHRKDSRHVELPDNFVDFILTSPPYWRLEYYGPEPEQLGTGSEIGGGDEPTYEEFLSSLKQVMAECYRVLKPGKFCCFAVNDFRLEGQFYFYHADCIRLLTEVGFIPHDIVIYNLSEHPLHAIFVTQLWERKHVAKQHEYLLVFKKPEAAT